jgi:hypothetical protein
LEGSANILGLACDGTHIFVNSGGTSITIYNMAGVLDSSHTVSNLPSGNNQMAYAGGYLYARKGTDLFRISTSDWTSTQVTVDASYPMLTCGDWMSGSLFETPDGKLGVMGPTSGGVFTVRLYTVSANGLTITRDQDYTINDGWNPDNHGMACDGTREGGGSVQRLRCQGTDDLGDSRRQPGHVHVPQGHHGPALDGLSGGQYQ